jgi:hypothetical protein
MNMTPIPFPTISTTPYYRTEQGEAYDAVQVLTSPWASSFYDLVESAEERLLIATPFMSNGPLTKVVGILCAKSSMTGIQVEVLTNLAVDSCDGKLPVDAKKPASTPGFECTPSNAPA